MDRWIILLSGLEVTKLQQSAKFYNISPPYNKDIRYAVDSAKGGKSSEEAIADAGSGIHGMHTGAEQCCVAGSSACRERDADRQRHFDQLSARCEESGARRGDVCLHQHLSRGGRGAFSAL